MKTFYTEHVEPDGKRYAAQPVYAETWEEAEFACSMMDKEVVGEFVEEIPADAATEARMRALASQS